MTIKTAVTLTAGAAVGFLFGITASDKTKERIVSSIKKRYLGILFGPDEINSKPKYAAYQSKKPDYSFDAGKTLKFQNEAEADSTLKFMKEIASTYGVVSLFEICNYRKMPADYTYTKYGWNEKEVLGSYVLYDREQNCWIIRTAYRAHTLFD